MNKFLSILLPHSDDELFIQPFIETQINQGYTVKIFFITYDFNPVRANESGKMLSLYKGVQTFQLGRLNNIVDGNLNKSFAEVTKLLEANPDILASEFLVCPIIEGGHMDHDEIFKIGYSLASKLNKPLYSFSLYNAYQTPFVRVATLFKGPVSGEIETFSFSLNDGYRYLKNSFYYKSQFVILSILFPGLLRTFLFKRKIEVIKVKNFDENIPHPGRLFYANPWKNKIKSLLRVS